MSFTESDNPTLFHPDFWTRFRTYSYLCALNARLLLSPNTLCYDWSMDSIPRIESWWDMRNVETLTFALILGWLCFYGKVSFQTVISVIVNASFASDKRRPQVRGRELSPFLSVFLVTSFCGFPRIYIRAFNSTRIVPQFFLILRFNFCLYYITDGFQ